jgi:hypothetical protein
MMRFNESTTGISVNFLFSFLQAVKEGQWFPLNFVILSNRNRVSDVVKYDSILDAMIASDGSP